MQATQVETSRDIEIKHFFKETEEVINELIDFNSQAKSIEVFESAFRELSCLINKAVWNHKTISKIAFLSNGCSIILKPIFGYSKINDKLSKRLRFIAIKAEAHLQTICRNIGLSQ